jgi:DNA-binding HxlR family transcriptional regulator
MLLFNFRVNNYNNPTEIALDLIGGKYKILIL